jgi:hypothetical protein
MIIITVGFILAIFGALLIVCSGDAWGFGALIVGFGSGVFFHSILTRPLTWNDTSNEIPETYTYKILLQLMSAFSALQRQIMNPDLIQETPDYVRGYQDGIRAASRLTHDVASLELDNF